MKFKKMLFLTTTALLLVLVGPSIDSYAKEKFVSNQEIIPYAEIIDWRYKPEGSRNKKCISKRQFAGENALSGQRKCHKKVDPLIPELAIL